MVTQTQRTMIHILADFFDYLNTSYPQSKVVLIAGFSGFSVDEVHDVLVPPEPVPVDPGSTEDLPRLPLDEKLSCGCLVGKHTVDTCAEVAYQRLYADAYPSLSDSERRDYR